MAPIDLSLDGRIYRATAVREAAAAFSHLARVRVRKRGGRHRVRIEPLVEDRAAARTIADEFANYALGMTLRDRS